MEQLNLSSPRARKARTAKSLRSLGSNYVLIAVVAAVVAGLVLTRVDNVRLGYASLGLAFVLFMLEMWVRLDLENLPVYPEAKSLEDLIEPELLARFSKKNLTPQTAWQAAAAQWQGRFIANRLLIDAKSLSDVLETEPTKMPDIWKSAAQLATKHQAGEINAGTLTTAILLNSKPATDYLATINIGQEDITEVFEWLARLNNFINQPKPYFGGVGRDWAAGFTPTLDRFGQNFSKSVEFGHNHFHTLAHADILDSVVHNLDSGMGNVALVGDAGTGKTSLVYALAERLLQGKDEKLRYYQIVSLNASQIISAAGDKLEEIILTLLAEAVHARNIIIFLDDANLFFGKGTGALDIGQVLSPILQNHAVKIITAFTPNDFQHLKTSNEVLTAQMASINVTEPADAVVLKILEDTALTMEQHNDISISFQAVREAFRLGGQYYQDQAYPGKSINLMEQAIPYCSGGVMTAESLQQAVEKTRGFKVTKAQGAEADALLHLEDEIHKRMINQKKAVSVVSAALRRSRAGVANPNRPIGSFLFLGPTGVGKTELARSLAATYFGDEHQMIRLDMSEYQQAKDVERLLETGEDNTQSLLISIRAQPFSVVLLDEVEKAHPSILNLLLQLFDEGQLTDKNGKPASFKNAIIINTSNAGATEISKRIESGESLDEFERPLIEKLIDQGIFKPELVNRFDEIVLFRPLNQEEMVQVAKLMIEELNKNLSKQNIKVKLTGAALARIVKDGYDPEFGARPMRRVIQKSVEDAVATRIIGGQTKPGSTIELDVSDLGDSK